MADVNNETQETLQATATATAESKLDQETVNAINSAVSTHLKRHLSKLPEMIAAALPQPSSQGSSDSSKHSGKNPDALDEVQKLRAELDAERKRSREKETFNSVRSYLSDKVRPEALESAVKVLKADQLVKFNRDGTPMVKFTDGEEFPLEEGLAQWLGSKEAQIFRPAPSAKPAAGQKPAYRNPAKVTAGGEGSGSANLSNSEKTLQQLQKLGISF